MYHKAIAELSKDEKLRALIKTIGPIEFKPKRIDPYKSIIRAIIYQQLTGMAAGTIFDRFLKLAPTTAFPKPEFILELSEQSLRSAGLSGSKVSYIKAVAKMTASGDLPPLKKFDKMNDLEIIDAGKLGIMDSRKLGVLLESVVLKKADGAELKLQHLGS